MNNIFKILALSLFATVSMAASDHEQEGDHQPFRMTVATQHKGDIEVYGDPTKFLITRVLNQEVLAQSFSVSRIKNIDLSGMELTGDFPREIGLLPNLKELNLSDNALTGVDLSGFEKGTSCQRVLYLGIFHNPLKTFTGPTDKNVIVRLRYSRDIISVHFDATVFEHGDFSPLKDLLKLNIQSDVTEELTALQNIRISFDEITPISPTLTEKFGITHDGKELCMGTGTTVITRQWFDGENPTCQINVDYLVKHYQKEPVLNALQTVLNSVYQDGEDVLVNKSKSARKTEKSVV